MKLSDKTVSILKYLQEINQGLVFKPGKVLRTMSPHSNILVDAVIEETIPSEFGIYDLKEFLGALSIYKDDFDINFGSKVIEIKGRGGRSKTSYTCTETSLIITPPDKEINVTGDSVTFKLTEDDLDWIKNTASVLKSPQIVVESDGKEIHLSTMDVKNNAANVNRTSIGSGNGKKYKLVFRAENFKLMPQDYDVTVTARLGHFVNEDKTMKVWISTEEDSKFDGGAN